MPVLSGTEPSPGEVRRFAPPQPSGPPPDPAGLSQPPSFQPPGRQLDTIGPNPQYQVTPDERFQIEAAILMVNPGLNGDKPGMQKALDRFETHVATPEWLQLLNTNFLSAMSQGTDEYLMAQVMERTLDRDSPGGWLEATIRSALQRITETDQAVFTAGQVINDRRLIATEFTASTQRFDEVFDTVLKGFGPLGSNDRRDLRTAIAEGTSRSGLFKVDDSGRNVAIMFNDPTDLVGARKEWAGLLRLDPDTEISDTADVMAAYALAQMGLKHEWEGDDVPGAQAQISFAGSLGNTLRFGEQYGAAPLYNGLVAVTRMLPPVAALQAAGAEADLATAREGLSPYAQAAQARIAHLRGETESTVATESTAARDFVVQAEYLVRPESVAADITRTLGETGVADQEAFLTATEGVQAMSAADPDFLAEARTKTSDELMADFNQTQDDRGVMQSFLVDEILTPTMEAAAAYDKAVHMIGLSLLAIPDAAQNELDRDGSTTFRQAFTDAYADENVATYLGVEPDSAFATWVNLGASILFDPITWFTPGARASWAWTRELLTNPNMTQTLLTQPHMRSGIRQIVQKTDSRLAYSFMGSMDNGDDVVRLLEIAGDTIPKGAQPKFAREVVEILGRNIKDGTYLPAGPTRLKFVKDIQGIRVPFQHSGKLNDAGVARLAQIVTRASRDRGATLTDDFLDDVLSATIMRHPDDQLRQAEIMDRAVKAWKLHRQGKPAVGPHQQQWAREAVAAETVRVEKVKRELGNVSRALDSPDLRLVPEHRATLVRANAELDEAVRIGGDLEAVRGIRDYAQSQVDQFGARYDELIEQQVAGQRRFAAIETESQMLLQPGDTQNLERFWHEFYDDWGRSLGLKELSQPHPYLPDRNLLDWTVVTGERTVFPNADNTVGISGWVGGDVTLNPNLADNLYSVGMGARQGMTLIPASPFQTLAYANTPSKKMYARFLTEGGRKVSRGADLMQNVFAATVLLNLTTPIKTHLDEIIRFIQDAGFTSETLLQASSPTRLSVPFTKGRVGVDIPGTQAEHLGRQAQASRVQANPAAHRIQPWETVDPSKTGNWEAAERWINGTMLNDDMFKAYARSVTNSTSDEDAVRLFTQWWDEGIDDGPAGHVLARKQIKTATGSRDASGRDTFDIIGQGFDEFLKGAKDDFRVQLRDDLLQAAGNNRKLDKYRPVQWRQSPPVPGQDRSPNGVIDRLFSMLYGTPSQRRGSVIYDHYYDWARDTYAARFTDRIIDTDALLAADETLTPLQANAAIAAGDRSTIIRSLKAKGWHYQSDLDNAASRWATRQSDSMMYQMGSVSVLGKKLSRFYPWGRAQFDYVGYWTRKMMEPTQITPNPLTNLGIGAGRVATPNLGGLNRVNLRLMDRIGHMVALGNGDDERPDPYTPRWFIDSYSFMPSALDDAFVVDNAVSPAPWVTNSINFLPEDHPLRVMFEEVHPSHKVFADYTNHGIEGIFNYINAVAPESSRSMRNTIATVVKTLLGTGLVSADQAQLNGVIDWLTIEAEPPFYRDQLALVVMEKLAEEGYDPAMVPSSIDPRTPSNRWWDEAQEEALRRAYSREGPRYAGKQVGLPSHFGSEAMYAKAYLPMEPYLAEWVDAGYISQGVADEFRAASELAGPALRDEAGVTDYRQVEPRRALVDAGSDILFRSDIPDTARDEFVIMNPESVVNMTHWQEVDFDLVPERWQDSIQGVRIKPGISGELRREMVKEGRAGGWVITRDPSDWMRQLNSVKDGAGRRWLRDLWTEQTGVKWTQGTQDLLGLPFEVDPETGRRYAQVIEQLQVDITGKVAEWVKAGEERGLPTGSWWVGSFDEFKKFLTDSRDTLFYDTDLSNEVTAALERTDAGKTLHDRWTRTVQWAASQGVDSVDEWDQLDGATPLSFRFAGDGDTFDPWLGAEAEKERFREDFRTVVSLSAANDDFGPGTFTEPIYDRTWGWQLGTLDYKPPEPPPSSQLTQAVSAGPDRFLAIDGDTIDYFAADGERVRFRLMGINAPEDPNVNPDALQSKQNLQSLLDESDDITIGQFDTERFGTTQRFYTRDEKGQAVKNERVFAWLYIDGTPVWSPDAFSSDNPRGVGVGGTVPEYRNWIIREKGGVS